MNAHRSTIAAARSLTRRAWRPAALAVALCAGGAACDEEFEVANAEPDVVIEGWCTANDRAYLVVTVFDLERDPVDLALCFGERGLATGPSGDGLRGLTSGPDGQLHRIEWATGGDCVCPGVSAPSCEPAPTEGVEPAATVYASTALPPTFDWLPVTDGSIPALGACR